MNPRPGVNTGKSGWMNDPNNVYYDERIEITRGLKKAGGEARLILNLSDKTFEKNTWQMDLTFNEYFKHFFKSYHDYITAVMVKLDADYLNSMLDEMQAELDATKDLPTTAE